jgi:hypothetical protein
VKNSLWIAIVMAILLLSTRAVELGDTQVYANDIVDHFGKSLFGSGNSLWDFGHLIWRPLGWALLSLTTPLLSAWTGFTIFMQASFVLVVVSVLCSLISVVLWYVMAIRLSGSKPVAFMVTIALACSHGFLLYAHSGCAYIPGVACLTASLYFLTTRRPIAAGIFYALSTLLWLPFILGGAALLLIAAFPSADWNQPLSEKLPKVDWAGAIRFTVASAIVVLLVYGFALYARRISSVAEAREWAVSSGHGWSQNIKVVRAATGVPRSFLYLGKDGILFKRYLRHDPYSPVTLRDLAGASLWKLAAFYLFSGCLLSELLRRLPSWPLLFFSAVAVPVISFAVIIFEPGSPERYLPAFPFLLLAIVWVLRDFPTSRRVTQSVIAAFLLCVVLANGYSFAAPRVSAEDNTALSRITGFRNRVAGKSIIMVATNQDDLEPPLNRLVFGDINRPTPVPLFDIVEAGNTRTLTWQSGLAARVLEAWAADGEVWVTKRVWSSRPLPSWNWVEGDDPHVSWRDLPPFFATLSTDAESGGPDGFLRLARNEHNLALLTPLAAVAAASH